MKQDSRKEEIEMESLPVPSVQAMVAATGGAHVPPRYLRPEVTADAVVAGAAIPIIDFERLLHPDLPEACGCGDESARLHAACQEWGFFQVWLIWFLISFLLMNITII